MADTYGPTLDELGTTPADVNQTILADALTGAPNSIPSDLSFFGANNPDAFLWADPTNTGDRGSLSDVSTPTIAGADNPETASGGGLSSVLNNLINVGFTSWQLSQQPASAQRRIDATVGGTRVQSGGFGLTTAQRSQFTTIAIIVVIAVVGLFLFKALTRTAAA